MKKIKTIYNDKKMVLQNPDRKGNTRTRDVIGGAKTQSDYLPTIGTAWYHYGDWGEKILQTQPERAARPVFDAGYAQSG